jgi:hypothetical protein
MSGDGFAGSDGDGVGAGDFARAFLAFMGDIHLLAREGRSPVRDVMDAHFAAPSGELPVLADRLEAPEHPNMQRCVDELVGEGWQAIGLPLELRHHGGFSLSALARARSGDIEAGPIEYVDMPIGPDETLPCAQMALYLGRWEGTPVGVLLVSGDERMREPGLTVEVMAPDRERAGAFLRHLRARRATLNVYRGKTVSFTFSPFGRVGLGFVPVPPLERHQVILPEADLSAIEEHTVGIAARAGALRAAGRHMRRGLLLYGPPGTGKTLSVMYLCNRMPERTTVVLSGPNTAVLGQAVALAESLAPAMVVLEDVDLVAEDRTHSRGGENPLLFQLLNAMDGLSEDADVIFVLTTNRVDLLEPALAARPGRIDQAVEIGLPDAAARVRLFDLYLGDLAAADVDLDTLVAATEGVSPAFIRELVRRAVLGALDGPVTGGDGATPVVDASHLAGALRRLQESGAPVLRALLGAGGAADATVVRG